MKRHKYRALVLARRSVGEADRLVSLFTQEEGIVQVLAKGVRKIPSRRGGHLEPFTEILTVVNETHDRYYLSHVETLDAFPVLHRSGDAMEHVQHLFRLLLDVWQEGDPQEDVYRMLKDVCILMPDLSYGKRVALETAAMLTILRAAGLQPALEACQHCGVKVPADAVILDSQEGGWHCLLCHSSLAGTETSLAPQLVRVLKFLARRPHEALKLVVPEEEARQLNFALREYANINRVYA